MTIIVNLFITASLFLSLPTSAGELEDLIALKIAANKELITLKSTGIGSQHPEIIAKEKEINKLKDQIEDQKINLQEIVILLKGTSSLYLKGHQKFGKSETALPTLLLNGWKIQNIINTGDEKAYIWLTRE